MCVLVEAAVEGTAASSAGSRQAPRKTRIAAMARAPQATRGWWVRPGRLLVPSVKYQERVTRGGTSDLMMCVPSAST